MSAAVAVPARAPLPLRGDPRPGARPALAAAAYDVAWLAALALASPWWGVRAAIDRRFRAHAFERCALDDAPRTERARPRVLVHCVSVGEVKAARSIVTALRDARPDLDVVVSCVTDTGIDVARKSYPDLLVVRFPLDARFARRRFLARVDPACIVLVELELWPGFLRDASRRGIPIAIVNGRIREKSVERYARLDRWMALGARLSLVAAQDETYARRFRSIGVDPARIVVTGNVKLDALRTSDAVPTRDLASFVRTPERALVVVGGSTHAPEESLLVSAWRSHVPDARLVIVPRHPERCASVASEIERAGTPVQLLSRLRAGEPVDAARPLVVDTVGELEALWSLADVAFVGGGFGTRGGQNMLEPASRGRPALYGPNTSNFESEARLLETAGASRRLAHESELGPALAELCADPALRSRMGAAGRASIEGLQGATARTLAALLERVLPEPLAVDRNSNVDA